ncbi:MAG: trypsin-like peptidase domain-containing protein [Reyranellales bacterium]
MGEFRRNLLGLMATLAAGAWSLAVAAADPAGEPASTVCGWAVLCQSAPCSGTTRWDPRRDNAPYVAEAMRRGYTLGYCAVVLRAAPATPAPSQAASSTAAPTSESLVSSIQTLLSVLGHDIGPFDGTIGPKTRAAIASFQKSVGLPADGVPSEDLYTRLKIAVAERSGGHGANVAGKPPNFGTGFYISSDIVVTNSHVIEGCTEIWGRKHGQDVGGMQLVVANKVDDLAALRASKFNAQYLKLRVDAPVKAAEAVLVFGYPLAFALSSSGNTTLGNVTALAGLNDDPRFIQISAAVQRGNSGGPVLDEAGRLIGVTHAKLDAYRYARETGEIPENVNFAIRATTLARFLYTNRIAYEVATASAKLANTELAEQAEAASVQLECRK